MTQPPSVLLADDDARGAAGMARALRDAGFVVAIESEARRLLLRLERERPHLLVIDAEFGLHAGLDAASLASLRWLGFLFVSASSDPATVARVAAIPCAAFLLKPFRRDQLIAAARVAIEVRGTRPAGFDPNELLDRIASLVQGPGRTPSFEFDGLAELSTREREIVATLLRHGRVVAVARALHLSPHTVRNHLRSIYQKLDVHSIHQLFERVHGAPMRDDHAIRGS